MGLGRPGPDDSGHWKAAARGVESTVCNAAVESKGHCNDGESTGWITVAADRLNRHYRFALKESLSSGRYRVLWEQQDPSIARSDLRFRFTG